MIPCLVGITRSALSIVIMVVAHGNVVRPLGSEHIRCPLFRRGPFLGRRTGYIYWLVFWREYLSREARSHIQSHALNGEVTAGLQFLTRVLHSLGMSCEATARFVCSRFWLFKLEKEVFVFLYFIFPLLLRGVFLSPVSSFSSFSDLGFFVSIGSYV